MSVDFMDNQLQFGVITLQHLPWEAEVARWQRMEAVGFDSIWLADHFVNFVQPTAPWYEAWTWLAALATQTKTIRIGTLVTPITWRNPAWLARQAMTVDHISHGRLELGIGAGAPAILDCSYAMTGTPDWPPAERVARVREVVEILDSLLREEVTSYQGKYYQLKGSAMNPPTIQQPRPPITIGALGPRMLKITAQFADRWNSYGGDNLTADEMLKLTQERTLRLNDYCLQFNRDPKTLLRSLLVYGAPAEMAYTSVNGFYEVIGTYREAGIQEFILYYPFMDHHVPVFDQIIHEEIPKIRKGFE
jgi:alkanesulfonate monooxygenase SsuD/methylene tetrahydromethanopterin reductase-like flavin-dependent oxidoreductase (luciferase family)